MNGIRDYDKDNDGDYIKEVILKNEQPTGTLIVNKSVALKENVDTSIVDISDLSDIQFKLTAKEDIINKIDGSIIYKKGQEIKTYNLSKEGTLRIEGLPLGKFELYETKTKDGLVLNKTKYEVEFKQEDLTTKEIIEKRDITNDTTLVEISKQDITGEKELEGATLSVLDEKGNVIDTWVSENETHKIEGLTVNKTFILREEIAAEGFVKATDIKFTVKDTSEIQKVTMIDKVVTMTKKDIAGEEIEGAELKVYDEKGKIVDEWTSTKEPHKIKNLVEGKKYILKEQLVKEPYVIASDIEFTVTTDKQTQKIEMIDKIVEMSKKDVAGNEIEGATMVVTSKKTKNIVDKWISGKESHKIKGLIEGESYILHEEIACDKFVKATDIEFTVSLDKETQKVEMIDKQVLISKTDLVTGEELEGAELTVTDKEGNIIDTWISTKEPHYVSGLEEGKAYVLTEVTCPYGFEQAESIEFTVTTDKETQKIEMKDMPILTDVQLVKIDSKTKENIKAKFTFGIYEDEACTKLIKEVESDKKTGIVTFEDLRYETVFIKELRSPKGYILSDKIIKLEINDKGIFVDGNKIEEIDNIYSFTFENAPMDTPKTGDERNTLAYVILFSLSALGVVTISVISYKKRKNK